MSLKAEIKKHEWWINLVLGICGASGFIGEGMGIISNDIFDLLIIILFLILVIMNLYYIRQHKSTAEASVINETSIKPEDKEELKLWKNKAESLQEELEILFRKCQNNELEKLIIPVCIAFDKYPDDPKAMKRDKFGLPLKWSLMLHPYEKSSKADPIIDVLQRYGNLAQPELRQLIRQFLEFKQAQKERVIRINDSYFDETAETVEKIKSLVLIRYNELMWGDEEKLRLIA